MGVIAVDHGLSPNCADSVSPPDFDANNIFKAFFGGPGGFSFEGNLCIIFV